MAAFVPFLLVLPPAAGPLAAARFPSTACFQGQALPAQPLFVPSASRSARGRLIHRAEKALVFLMPRKSPDELARAGIDALLADPSPLLPYVSRRVGRPVERIDQYPVEMLELMEASSEGGILKALRGQVTARSYSSGMTGISRALLNLLDQNRPAGHPAHVVTLIPAYGGTYALLNRLRQSPEDYAVTDVSIADGQALFLKRLEQAIRPDTRLVYLESITNPTLDIPDLRDIERIVRFKERQYNTRIVIAVDNAFATSRGTQPLQWGADVSLQTITKGETGGQAAGSVVVGKPDVMAHFPPSQLKPETAQRAIAGLRTLPRRLRIQSESAAKLAIWLDIQSDLKSGLIRPGSVRYPGSSRHPQAREAEELLASYGYMLYWEFKTPEQAEHFINLLRYFRLVENAVSLGKTETLAEIPADATAKFMGDAQKLSGVRPAGIRLSVGLERYEDLLRELEALFTVLRDHPKDLDSGAYEPLDALLMAPRPDGKPLIRRIPELEATPRSLDDVIGEWLQETGDGAPVAGLVKMIHDATRYDRYDPFSLALHASTVWGILTGNHLSLEIGHGLSTTYRKSDAADMARQFSPHHEVLGGFPGAYFSLYYRWGTPGSKTFEILGAALVTSIARALRLETVGLSFPSVAAARESVQRLGAIPEDGDWSQPLEQVKGRYVVYPVVLFGRELGALVVTDAPGADQLGPMRAELSNAMEDSVIAEAIHFFIPELRLKQQERHDSGHLAAHAA